MSGRFPSAEVIPLAEVRERRRLGAYRSQVESAICSNRDAIETLCSRGTLFTSRGARAGRDLLLAHNHLLKVLSLLERLDRRLGPAPAGTETNATVVFEELDRLISRTTHLAARSDTSLRKLAAERDD